jgi:hypothetical protein
LVPASALRRVARRLALPARLRNNAAMRPGIVILNIAALVWLAAAFGALYLPAWAYGLPVALSAGIGGLSLSASRWMAPPPPEVGRRIGRTVGLWSTVEAVLIALAVVVLVRLGQPALIGPVVALIVGLHFIPMAPALGVPLYYWTGAGLVVVGVGALLLPFRPMLASAGIGAAAVLYATSVGLVAGPLKPRRSPASAASRRR